MRTARLEIFASRYSGGSMAGIDPFCLGGGGYAIPVGGASFLGARKQDWNRIDETAACTSAESYHALLASDARFRLSTDGPCPEEFAIRPGQYESRVMPIGELPAVVARLRELGFGPWQTAYEAGTAADKWVE